jgi:hypothetical protein
MTGFVYTVGTTILGLFLAETLIRARPEKGIFREPQVSSRARRSQVGGDPRVCAQCDCKMIAALQRQGPWRRTAALAGGRGDW